MNTSAYIAKRYLFSRKKMNAINIISGISIVGVLIGSAALIIILSGFNGLEQTIVSLYSNFTPEIKIEPKFGKTFNPDTGYFNTLKNDSRVFSYTKVLREKVLIKYDDKPIIGTIMGVGKDFTKNKQLDSIIVNGAFILKNDKENYAVIGATIQSSLGVSVRDQLRYLEIYSPRADAGNGANPLNEFVVKTITPSGVFATNPDFDNLVITPINFARDLLNQPKNVSSIDINFKKGADIEPIKDLIKEKLGNKFTVKNRGEQYANLYKTLNYEHWIIFLILTFVLIIAIFNIIGSLTMLVIDKRADIAILTSLGANKTLIQRIFFFEGMMISMIGCISGIFLGFIFCILQKKFGLVKMGTNITGVDAYPVAIKGTDFILVFLTVLIIATTASFISSRLSIKGLSNIKDEL